ncbi:MAG TPA: nitroreductase family protein [Burkholderiales bacterium]
MSAQQNAAAVFAYHLRSKHRLDGYAPGPGHLDWASQPDPFRCFDGAQRLPLPLLADALGTPFSSVRAGALPPPRPLDLDGVATLLELSLGLSAWKSFRGSTWALRCNPSSGNLHPTEGYLVCAGVPGLAPGVHHYVSRDHALERRAEPVAGWGAAFPEGGVIIGLASIHWREAWKYGMRAFRYFQHDAGHAMAAVAYAAAALGWRARRLGAWGDADIAALLGLDRSEDFAGAEEEAPDLLLWVGPGEARPDPRALLAALEGARWRGRANCLSSSHREWPDIPAVHVAAVKPRTPVEPALHPPALPPPAAAGKGLSAARLIRQRRSAVDFDGVTEIGAGAFFSMLDALLPRAGVPPWETLDHAPRVHPALFVHRVAGVAPGLYLLLRDVAQLEALKRQLRQDGRWQKTGPAQLPLYLLAEGDLRDHARLVSCHQDIAADSCFALGFLSRFHDVVGSQPWRYRELYWETGLLGQVLYLEAEAAGVRGTGIGCFFDDTMHALLGIEGDGYQSLYHFTVGGPVEDPRLTTLPPYAGR